MISMTELDAKSETILMGTKMMLTTIIAIIHPGVSKAYTSAALVV
jgi:hypothetical protein